MARIATRRASPIMVRFGAMVLRVPRYLHLAYRLARDSRLTASGRLLAIAGGAYMISPIDPVPGFIPVLGQLDDMAVLLLTLRQALRACPPEIAAEHMAQTGVTFAAIDADLATVRTTTVWIAQKAGQAVGSIMKGVAQQGQRRLGAAVRGLLPRRTPTAG